MSLIAPPRAADALSSPSPPTASPVGAARPPSHSGAVAGTTEAVAASTAPNPALRMDAELGLVVLEFRNSRGEAVATIPTSRELDAYRRAVRTGAPLPKL